MEVSTLNFFDDHIVALTAQLASPVSTPNNRIPLAPINSQSPITPRVAASGGKAMVKSENENTPVHQGVNSPVVAPLMATLASHQRLAVKPEPGMSVSATKTMFLLPLEKVALS